MVQPLSRFSGLSTLALDEIFALQAKYLADSDPNKVSLGIGVYRTEDGKCWPLPSVAAAEHRWLMADNDARHEYLGIQGDVRFLELARDVAFSFPDPPLCSRAQNSNKSRIVSVQTVSGSGANHLGALFLSRTIHPKNVWLPDPTWNNHHAIWELVGVTRKTYPYYNAADKCFDYDGALEALEEAAEEGDVVVFHACAHNPTGSDPSKEQWQAIGDLCERKRLFPLFDLAYQGFASGNLEEDGWVIKHFLERPARPEFCIAQSFSKNFGLYGQRAGALHVVTSTTSVDVSCAVLSKLCQLIRGENSTAPRFGSEIVKTILESDELRRAWLDDLAQMSGRIQGMRRALYDELVQLQTPGSWEHILNQVSTPLSCLFRPGLTRTRGGCSPTAVFPNPRRLPCRQGTTCIY